MLFRSTDGKVALAELQAYNAAVRQDVPFNPNVKDGRGTRGLAIPKTNWANTLDTPPFEGYAVTCGITFTFGGLRITDDGPGFPAALLAQGTGRFRRSDAAGAVGIGLSIVQTIVGAHHGSVRLANRPGGGAEVSIVLPLRDV